MIINLGNILLQEIQSLPFIDKSAGIVRVINYKNKEGSKQSFPVDCKINLDDCNKNKRYLDLCPDSKKKSVLYLEDGGVRFVSREGHKLKWTARIDLICWLNLPLLGVSDNCSYSDTAIMSIMAKLPYRPFNRMNFYQYVNIRVAGENSKNINPFSKYSYDETINQYLMYPYDFFSLPIEIDFTTDDRCLKIEELNPEINCKQV